MHLNEKQLFDYIYCPLMFHVEQKTTKSAINLQKTSSDANVLEIITYFFAGILDGKLRTYKELEKKFQSFSSQTLNKDELLYAWEKIIAITEWAKSEQIMIGDIQKPYGYFTASSNEIKGTIDYIIVEKNRSITLLYFDLNNKRMDKNYLSRKLKYTLDYFGFERAYGKTPDFIKIHSVKYNEDYVFYKTENDRKRLDSTIDQVCYCIQHEIIFPRETYLCKNCTYCHYCNYWCKGSENDV